MPRPLPELPESLPAGVLSGDEVTAAGLSRRQLARAGLRRVHKRLWIRAAAAPTLETRCLAGLRVLPQGAAFGHGTAAAPLNLPLPSRLAAGPAAVDDEAPELEPLHASVVGPAHPRIRGLRVHRVLAPLPTATLRSGIVITSGARTWFDLASVLTRDDLVVVGEVILRRRLATMNELEEMLRAYAGRRGVRAAATALQLLNGRAQSPMETRLRLLLADNGFTGFLVNRPVTDASGGWLCVPDIQFPLLKVAIEYDGDQHRTDKNQWREDVRRQEALRENGWTLIPGTADDLRRRPQRIVEMIRRELDRRAAASAGG